MASPSRYSKYSHKINNGQYYSFTLYPYIININDTDFYKIIVKQGDRLDLLAKKYYNNSTFWWIIAMVNNIDGDSLLVQPGTILYIPKDYTSYVY